VPHKLVVPCPLHVRLPPLHCPWKFRTADPTRRNTFLEGDRQHERSQAEVWSVVGILLPLLSSSNSSGVTITKHTQNIYTCILRAETACIQLMVAGHCSQQELTAVYAISRTADVVKLNEYVDARAHRLRFNYHYVSNWYKSQICSHDTCT
jgi:hypothetical protein